MPSQLPTAVMKPVSRQEAEALVGSNVVYAILDSVGSPGIPDRLQRTPAERVRSLYAGTSFEAYTAVAPYLVHLNTELFRWLCETPWTDPWGVFVFSHRTLTELCGHFQLFLAATFPDGTINFFRFYDPRVLKPFLASDAPPSLGFWNGMVAYGWAEDDGVMTAARPQGLPDLPVQPGGVVFTPPLQEVFRRAQSEDFIKRCSAYLATMGLQLPQDAAGFFASFFRYAFSVGISTEIDLVRFALLVLGWKNLRTIPSLRDLLSYPDLAGTTKVDLLCEAAAFGDREEFGAAIGGLDAEAHAAALKAFTARHANDTAWERAHPSGGNLTLQPGDAPWRKEWLALYNVEVAARSKATDVALGAVQV